MGNGGAWSPTRVAICQGESDFSPHFPSGVGWVGEDLIGGLLVPRTAFNALLGESDHSKKGRGEG